MEKTIYINDVKKGAEVHFKNGRQAEVADDKKGLIRDVRMDNVNGGVDQGSCYAYDWKWVIQDGVRYKCMMTPKQEQQALMIKASLSKLRW